MPNGHYSIRADLAKNRLYMKLEGLLSEAQLKAAMDKTIEEGLKLRPGFGAINDISQLRPVSAYGLVQIKRAQQALRAHGIGHVIRVISRENVQTHLQFFRISRQSYAWGENAATTWEEAEKILDQLPPAGR